MVCCVKDIEDLGKTITVVNFTKKQWNCDK